MLVYQRVSHVFLRKSSLLSQDPVLFSEDPNGGSQRGKEGSESANPRGRPWGGDAVATPWRRRDKGWIKVGKNGSHLEKFGHSIDLTHE
jgi:hypothetical protein